MKGLERVEASVTPSVGRGHAWGELPAPAAAPADPAGLRGGGSRDPPRGLPREPLTPSPEPPCECGRSPRAAGLILRLLSPRGKAPI